MIWLKAVDHLSKTSQYYYVQAVSTEIALIRFLRQKS